MAELLLINPRRRRKAHAAPAKRRASVKRRRRNPVTVISSAAPHHRRKTRRVHARRRNPIFAHKRRHHARRRRNPIHMAGLSMNGIKAMLTEAAIGGAGSTLLDILMGYINPMLPTTLLSRSVNACWAPMMSLLSRLMSAPVCVREKKEIGIAWMCLNTLERMS